MTDTVIAAAAIGILGGAALVAKFDNSSCTNHVDGCVGPAALALAAAVPLLSLAAVEGVSAVYAP